MITKVPPPFTQQYRVTRNPASQWGNTGIKPKLKTDWIGTCTLHKTPKGPLMQIRPCLFWTTEPPQPRCLNPATLSSSLLSKGFMTRWLHNLRPSTMNSLYWARTFAETCLWETLGSDIFSVFLSIYHWMGPLHSYTASTSRLKH